MAVITGRTGLGTQPPDSRLSEYGSFDAAPYYLGGYVTVWRWLAIWNTRSESNALPLLYQP